MSIFSPIMSIPVLSAARIQRHALCLQKFQYDIHYKNPLSMGILMLFQVFHDVVNSSNVVESEFFQKKNQFSVLPLIHQRLP